MLLVLVFNTFSTIIIWKIQLLRGKLKKKKKSNMWQYLILANYNYLFFMYDRAKYLLVNYLFLTLHLTNNTTLIILSYSQM